MSANYTFGLDHLEHWLQTKGFCTFSLTYGAKPDNPHVGGAVPIAESSKQIADFIWHVKNMTEATKIDLIGHSEGAFQTLYTAKYGGVAEIVDNIVATAPATHGTTLGGMYDRAYVMGSISRNILGAFLQLTGNPVLDELGPDGPAVKKLIDGPIVQPGNSVTVLVSHTDGVVTPPLASFIQEESVANIFVQDYCPHDKVKHEDEGYDMNIWNLILNSLEKKVGRKFTCSNKY